VAIKCVSYLIRGIMPTSGAARASPEIGEDGCLGTFVPADRRDP
jgi:hypothetical protein